MSKAQTGGVQQMPRHRHPLAAKRKGHRTAVEGIAEQGKALPGEVNADLVGTAGVWRGLDQGKTIAPAEGAKFADGQLAPLRNDDGPASLPRTQTVFHSKKGGGAPATSARYVLSISRPANCPARARLAAA